MLTKSQIKYIQSLSQKKFRQENGTFVAEGPKLAKELLVSPHIEVLGVYALESWLSENRDLTENAGEVTEISPIELEKISGLKTNNQVVLVVKEPEFNFSKEMVKGKFSILLDDIQDPGNLGTIIRTADWFGVETIIASQNTADAYNPKVVQSTMGSIARVKLIYTDLYSWITNNSDIPVYAAVLTGKDIREFKPVEEAAFLFGNESKGVGEGLIGMSEYQLKIPSFGHAESLNAAVAAGIVLSYFRLK
ncbi:MAG TPA: RNA methyltransferase [Parasegetibacter sp.]|jgi:TrmH family RNA methyltransferase